MTMTIIVNRTVVIATIFSALLVILAVEQTVMAEKHISYRLWVKHEKSPNKRGTLPSGNQTWQWKLRHL